MNLIQKYGKKKMIIASSILAVIVLIVGIGTWYASEQNHKQEILDSIDITFVDEAVIEYGTEEVDFNLFINDKIGEPEITLPTDAIDTKVLGKSELTYKVSKDGYSKELKKEVEVKDTKAPEITLKSDEVTITIGEEFSPESNVESVKDPVDGDIVINNEITEDKNVYRITGEYEVNVEGSYDIVITAFDQNGNKQEKIFTLIVIKEELERPVSENSGNNRPSTNNKASNTSPSNTKPKNEQSDADSTQGSEKPGVCIPKYDNLANSGRYFLSQADADEFGFSQINDPKSEWGGTSFAVLRRRDGCGNIYYTVSLGDPDMSDLPGM